jgi:DNA-3-methyladenine glycosylase
MNKETKNARKKKLEKSPYFKNASHKVALKDQCDNIDSRTLNRYTDPEPKSETLHPDSIVTENSRLTFSFFNIPCIELAKALLGKVLVRKMYDGCILKGRIVETESYLGGDDKASISYGGKMTEKSKPMYMDPGTTFVYLTYGMYNLINISSKGKKH